jgi:hypothetical protein
MQTLAASMPPPPQGPVASPTMPPTTPPREHARPPAARAAPLPQDDPYAGLDQYIPERVVRRRTVRDQAQALVRWKAGWTRYTPQDPFWAEVASVIRRERGRSLVRWKDSWELAEDVDKALALAAAGQVLYAPGAREGSPDPRVQAPPSPPAPPPSPAAGPLAAPPPRPAVAKPQPQRQAPPPRAPSSPPPSPAAKPVRAAPPLRPRKRKRPARSKPPPPSEFLAYQFDYVEPPSSADDSEEEPAAPGPSRRRLARPETWKRNIKKPRLEPLVAEKAPCACALRCYQRLGREKRKQVRAAFQALARPQQKAYLRALIVLNPVKSKKHGLQMARKRQLRRFTAEYTIKAGDKRYRVCCRAFQAILGIGSKQVKLLNTYAFNNPRGLLVPDDLRGRHLNRPNRLPAEVVRRIDGHIASFPRESSHYALATTKTFLPADLSVRKMHRLYLEMHEPRAFAALGAEDEGDEAAPEEEGARASGLDMEDEEDSEMGAADVEMDARKEPGEGAKPQVKYDFYNERFRKFDLAFGKPEVDSCATCDELKLQVAAAVDEDAAQALREQRRAHLREADLGYKMR